MTKLELAKILAKCLHSGQNYGNDDYIKHLDDVYDTLLQFNIKDEAILVSAYLHDSLEDTQMKPALIEEFFGKEILEIVFAVTNEIGFNRKERSLKTYEKITKNPKATIVKLADRIANITFAKNNNNSGFFQMYAREHESFKHYLKTEANSEMWEHLEKLIKEEKENEI